GLDQRCTGYARRKGLDRFHSGAPIRLADLVRAHLKPRIQWHRLARFRHTLPVCQLSRHLAAKSITRPIDAYDVRSTDAYVEPLWPLLLPDRPARSRPTRSAFWGQGSTLTICLGRAQLLFIAFNRGTYLTHDEIPIRLRIAALQRGEHALVNPQRLACTFGVLPVKMSYDVGAIAQHEQYFGNPAVARRVHENRIEPHTNAHHAHEVALGYRHAN